MAKDWINCDECDTEYKVIKLTSSPVKESYCPFCGSEIIDDIFEGDFEED